MSGLVEWLERANAGRAQARAVLRRSLTFPPGTHVPSYPYVEPFLTDTADPWRRAVTYLVAGLWATQWREGQGGPRVPLATAAATHWKSTGSSSTERRFINLLDADADQLPHRLRQMVSLLKDQPIDFELLLRDLVYWNAEQRRTQTRWAREFYRAAEGERSAVDTSTDGVAQ